MVFFTYFHISSPRRVLVVSTGLCLLPIMSQLKKAFLLFGNFHVAVTKNSFSLISRIKNWYSSQALNSSLVLKKSYFSILL